MDPFLKFQIEQKLPESIKTNMPMKCNRSLYSEIKWRRRKMNKKKKKKYLKKMFYVIQRRKQAKEKRYQNILTLFQNIQEKKVENFDPYKMINRELEKAKFYGFKFDNSLLPIHMKYEGDLSSIIKGRAIKKKAK